MGAKLGVIQFTDGVGHVFLAYKLHHASVITVHVSVITVHVSIPYITCLPHVILQVLPTPAGGKA